jgi:hypothetical protein
VEIRRELRPRAVEQIRVRRSLCLVLQNLHRLGCIRRAGHFDHRERKNRKDRDYSLHIYALPEV